MAALFGTLVVSTVVPTDDQDAFATHDEEYGKGGYRTVENLQQRDLITADRRSLGMIVYVANEDRFYQLQGGIENINFVEIISSDFQKIAQEQTAQDGRLTSLEARADETDVEQAAQDGRLDTLETRADETDVEQGVQDNRLTIIEEKLPFQGSFLESVDFNFDQIINSEFDSEVHVALQYEQGTIEAGSETQTATVNVLRDGVLLYSRIVSFSNLGLTGDSSGAGGGGLLGAADPVTDATDVLAALNFRDQKFLTFYIPNGCTINLSDLGDGVSGQPAGATVFNKRSF